MKSVALSQLVRVKLVQPEVARTFTRLTPFDRLPVEWLPKLRNIPKNMRDNGMTRDVVFSAPSVQEVADAINNIAAVASTPQCTTAAATPQLTAVAPTPQLTIAAPTPQLTAVAPTPTTEGPLVININTLGGTKPNNTINQTLQPMPSARFDPPARPKKAQSMGLMDTLRTGVKSGEPCPSEWAEDYYSAWLGQAISGKVPYQLKANRKMYSPEHQDTVRQLEAQFRSDKWPQCRGQVPKWCAS
jgi:hypothetical protein